MDVYDLTVADVARFWSHVDRSDHEGCWEWTGGRYRGYGITSMKRVRCRSHRVAFALAHQEAPALNVLHTCDNPPCVNPNHLFLGNHAANMRDRNMKGRTFKHPGVLLGGAQKLTECDVLQIRGDVRGRRVVASEYGVSPKTIDDVRAGRRWGHLTEASKP